MAGVGTPVAITAAMLIGLGVNPLYAAGVCLVANTAPGAFGGTGIPTTVASPVTDIPDLAIPQRGIVQGDRQCSAIAAASIVAKVARDALMEELHRQDPRYGFDRHKGYATAEHLAAVARFGYSPAHRRSFRPPTLFDTIE